jgi:hypothetical protein
MSELENLRLLAESYRKQYLELRCQIESGSNPPSLDSSPTCVSDFPSWPNSPCLSPTHDQAPIPAGASLPNATPDAISIACDTGSSTTGLLSDVPTVDGASFAEMFLGNYQPTPLLDEQSAISVFLRSEDPYQQQLLGSAVDEQQQQQQQHHHHQQQQQQHHHQQQHQQQPDDSWVHHTFLQPQNLFFDDEHDERLLFREPSSDL